MERVWSVISRDACNTHCTNSISCDIFPRIVIEIVTYQLMDPDAFKMYLLINILRWYLGGETLNKQMILNNPWSLDFLYVYNVAS